VNLEPNLKKILEMNQGPRWILLMKIKNRAVKSHATVPLNNDNAWNKRG
jgi:hypothetical protein